MKLLVWLPTVGPVGLAFVVALAGSYLPGRWGGAGTVWAAAASAVGWAWLLTAKWQWVLWPRISIEFLLLPALVFVCAGAIGFRVRGRWVGVAAVCFAAWWLASAPAGRVQFWRVGFGAMAVAWLLARVGAREPRLAFGVALTAGFGLLFGAATTVWLGATAVVVAASAGLWLGRRGGLVPAGLSMVGVVGAEFGGGRLLRGGVGTVDLACLLALGAPLLIPRVERLLQRRAGRWAGSAAGVLVALGLASVAWMASRRLA